MKRRTETIINLAKAQVAAETSAISETITSEFSCHTLTPVLQTAEGNSQLSSAVTLTFSDYFRDPDTLFSIRPDLGSEATTEKSCYLDLQVTPTNISAEQGSSDGLLAEMIQRKIDDEKENSSSGLTQKGKVRKRKPKQSNGTKDEIKKRKAYELKEKHKLNPVCKKSCKRLCNQKIPATRREKINEEFWNQDWTARRLFVLHTTKKLEVKRRTKNTLLSDSRRNNTLKYYLKNEKGDTSEVCKLFYLSTLGFSNNNDTIVKLVSSCSDITVAKDRRGSHPKHKKIDRQAIYDHIQKYHPCVSHYRREHAPNKLYLPSDISIKMMYDDFVKTSPMIPCSYELYRHVVVKEKIFSFAHLGHEECEVCETFKLHNTSHTKENLELTCDCCRKWDVHIKRAQAAREFYRQDVEKARYSDDLYL
nr:unnamed protein product [Callosobruchus analis]